MNTILDTPLEKRTTVFPLGPDTTALYPGRDYRRAMAGLRKGAERGCRLLCLVGPAGIGKSMVLHTLRGKLPAGFISVISQPPLGGLLSRLAGGLGLDVSGVDEDAVRKYIRERFAAPRSRDGKVIQIIDDAETLSRGDLALLRRLYEPVQGQVLLVGQPGILSLFSADDGTRIAAEPDRVYYLEPLSRREVGAYIRHRLNEAGFDRGLFVPEAIAAIAAYSGGLPRLINLLCFTALASLEFDVGAPIAAELIHEAARQRMETGNYPYISPPYAFGSRRVPSAPPRDAGAPDRDSGEMREKIAAVAGERRARDARAERFGFGRAILSMAAGAVAGILITRMSLMGSAGLDFVPHASATAMSHAATPYLQRMKAALVDMAEWIISWAGPEPAYVGKPGAAQSGDANAMTAATAGPAIHGIDGQNRTAAALRDDKPSLAGTHDNAPADAAGQTLPAQSAAVDPASAAPEKAKAKAYVAEAAPGPGMDSADAAQQNPGVASAGRISVNDREHIAHLYAERAQYDIQSGRLEDAQISIRRGLRLAPDDAELRALKGGVPPGHTTVQMPQGIRPSLSAWINPAQDRGAGPYLPQTKHNWSGVGRAALADSDYGPQAALGGGILRDTKQETQEEIGGRK